MYKYKTKGVCSREIQFELEGTKITSLQFTGGCNGNTKGIASLVIGMDAEDVIKRCSDIDCNGRGTSCPAQLALALKNALAH